ncbi:hypothetical protein B0T24DRAFT_60481 [Lasiosphaeria ovina]|uniref:Uncharacterized protein n=1 Tax=Lasiosphaeria ovina TaxID=92902 RepID=A0AAE0NLG6_9PEZI|nr:hypothetical protein B0T24DRAFT_60481 [Lasiosphaeria ovina]
MKKPLWWLRWSWPRRSCRPRSCGTSCRAAFVSLSHSSRTFHHKTGPIPPPSSLEKFRAVTTTLTTANRTTTAFPSRSAASPVRLQQQCIQHALILGSGIRPYSQSSSSSSLPAMAEGVQWTGPLVRKTFFDFFAERGHTIGMPPSRCAHLGLCARRRTGAHVCNFDWRCRASESSCLEFALTDLASLRSAIVVGRPSQ